MRWLLGLVACLILCPLELQAQELPTIDVPVGDTRLEVQGQATMFGLWKPRYRFRVDAPSRITVDAAGPVPWVEVYRGEEQRRRSDRLLEYPGPTQNAPLPVVQPSFVAQPDHVYTLGVSSDWSGTLILRRERASHPPDLGPVGFKRVIKRVWGLGADSPRPFGLRRSVVFRAQAPRGRIRAELRTVSGDLRLSVLALGASPAWASTASASEGRYAVWFRLEKAGDVEIRVEHREDEQLSIPFELEVAMDRPTPSRPPIRVRPGRAFSVEGRAIEAGEQYGGYYHVERIVRPTAEGRLSFELSTGIEKAELVQLAPEYVPMASVEGGTLAVRVYKDRKYRLRLSRTKRGPYRARARLRPHRRPTPRAVDLDTERALEGTLSVDSGVEAGRETDLYALSPTASGLLVLEHADSNVEVSLERRGRRIAEGYPTSTGRRLTHYLLRGQPYLVVVSKNPRDLRPRVYRLKIELRKDDVTSPSAAWRPRLIAAAEGAGAGPQLSADGRFLADKPAGELVIRDLGARLPLGQVPGAWKVEFVWGGEALFVRGGGALNDPILLRLAGLGDAPRRTVPGTQIPGIDLRSLVARAGLPDVWGRQTGQSQPLDFSAAGYRWAIMTRRGDSPNEAQLVIVDSSRPLASRAVTSATLPAGHGELWQAQLSPNGRALGFLLRARKDSPAMAGALTEDGQLRLLPIRGWKPADSVAELVVESRGRRLAVVRRMKRRSRAVQWLELSGKDVRPRSVLETKAADLVAFSRRGDALIVRESYHEPLALKVVDRRGRTRALRKTDWDPASPRLIVREGFENESSRREVWRLGDRKPRTQLNVVADGVQPARLAASDSTGRFVHIEGIDYRVPQVVLDLATLETRLVGQGEARRVERDADGWLSIPRWKDGAPVRFARTSTLAERGGLQWGQNDGFRLFPMRDQWTAVDTWADPPTVSSFPLAVMKMPSLAVMDARAKQLVLAWDEGKVRLYGRDGQEAEARFPALEANLRAFGMRRALPLRVLSDDYIYADGYLYGASMDKHLDLFDAVIDGRSSRAVIDRRVTRLKPKLPRLRSGLREEDFFEEGGWTLPEGYVPQRFHLNHVLAKGPSGEIAFFDAENGIHRYDLVLDARGQVLILFPDGVYAGPRGVDHLLGFSNGAAVAPASLLDVDLNRPGEVLKRLGFAPSRVVQRYQKARARRLRRWGGRVPSTERAGPTLAEVPPLATKERRLALTVRAGDPDAVALHALVNGARPLGLGGLPVAGAMKLDLLLERGPNQVVLYTTDADKRVSVPRYFVVEGAFPREAQNARRTYFLGVGVSSYPDPTYRLRYPVKDVRDLDDALRVISGKGYRSKLLLDGQVTQRAVREARSFLETVRPGDWVFVLLAGHGFLDPQAGFRFATYDTDFSTESGLELSELEALVSGLPSSRVFLFIDSCHSGELEATPRPLAGALDGVVVRGVQRTRASGQNPAAVRSVDLFSDTLLGSGATIYAASSGEEYALEREDIKNGVFTRALIQGLAEGRASGDDDGVVTAEELRAYLLKTVSTLTGGRQRPQIRQASAASTQAVAFALRPQMEIELEDAVDLAGLRLSSDRRRLTLLEGSYPLKKVHFLTLPRAKRRVVDVAAQKSEPLQISETATLVALKDGSLVSARHGLIPGRTNRTKYETMVAASRDGRFALRVFPEPFEVVVDRLDGAKPSAKFVEAKFLDGLPDRLIWALGRLRMTSIGPDPYHPSRFIVLVAGFALTFDPVSRRFSHRGKLPWNELPGATFDEYVSLARKANPAEWDPRFSTPRSAGGEGYLLGRFAKRKQYGNDQQTFAYLSSNGWEAVQFPVPPTDAQLRLARERDIPVRAAARYFPPSTPNSPLPTAKWITAHMIAIPAPSVEGNAERFGPDRALAFRSLIDGRPAGWFESEHLYRSDTAADGQGGLWWLRYGRQLVRFVPQ